MSVMHSRTLAWLVAAVALATPACGADAEPATNEAPATRQTGTTPANLRDCQTVGRGASGEIVLCQERGPDNHGVFVGDDGVSTRVIDVEPPGPTPTASAAGRVGHWAWAALSPDGSMLLAQWSAECEVPIAFFAPVKGGEPQVVSGERDWATSPTSIALGWTADGRAIVLFPDASPCGSTRESGLYLIGVEGNQTRIRGVDGFAERLQPSLKPRSVESLR
jgi:hypothetical protein